MSNVFSVMRSAHQEGPGRAQVFKPCRPKIMRIRKEMDDACITLHHALIDDCGESQVFSPNTHAHHEIEVG